MINSYVALDIETTGINLTKDRIIEIGMAKIVDGEMVEKYSKLINPGMKLLDRIVELTGITDEMLAEKPYIDEVIKEVIEFIGDLPILGHNIIFDYSFIKKAACNCDLEFDPMGIDTLKIARRIYPDMESRALSYMCEVLNVDSGNSHRAYDDAVSAMKIYEIMSKKNPEDSGFETPRKLVVSVKKDSPITEAQTRYLKALINRHGIDFPYQIDIMTKSQASREIDKILSEFGR